MEKQVRLNRFTVKDIQDNLENLINSNEFIFGNASGLLRLNGIRVAEGNNNEIPEIESRLIKIIKNENIINYHLELNKSQSGLSIKK